jgi:hypothetical protein
VTDILELAGRVAEDIGPFVGPALSSVVTGAEESTGAALARRLWSHIRGYFPNALDVADAEMSEEALQAELVRVMSQHDDLVRDIEVVYSSVTSRIQQRGRQNIAIGGNVDNSTINVHPT